MKRSIPIAATLLLVVSLNAAHSPRAPRRQKSDGRTVVGKVLRVIKARLGVLGDSPLPPVPAPPPCTTPGC